jgi:AAA15 family ATPase/GTPase
MGGGVGKLLSCLLAIAEAAHGTVLLDEVENGLHHSVLPKVWAAIAAFARKFDTQVLATTHSLECISAAHEAFSATGEYDLALHRLDRVEDEIRAVTYDQEMLDAAIKADMEIR